MSIPAAIVAATAYGVSLADCDWLHGAAESLLTVTNLLVSKSKRMTDDGPFCRDSLLSLVRDHRLPPLSQLQVVLGFRQALADNETSPELAAVTEAVSGYGESDEGASSITTAQSFAPE